MLTVGVLYPAANCRMHTITVCFGIVYDYMFVHGIIIYHNVGFLHCPSLSTRAWLERNTQYAFIDQELWILLSHPFYRKKFKEYIINEKVLKVYNDEKNKGILKSLLHLLMVI